MAEFTVISVSGPPAARDAMRALRGGKHVVLLGGGVSLEEEVELKQTAAEREILLLGPESGTAIIEGKGYGFANVVRRGPVGIIGTLGTGIQEVSCLVDEVGVSHALGVGPRDLSQKVDGLGTMGALKFLEKDESTKVIVVVALVPATSVARRVLKAIKVAEKPAVVCFLGSGRGTKFPRGVIPAQTLEDAAAQAVALVEKREPHEVTFAPSPEEVRKIAEQEHRRFSYGQKYIRGLYSGGMLCAEAMVVMQELIGGVRSNVPLKPRLRLPDPHSSRGHACVDFGAVELTQGRHPVVDLGPRCERMLKEARDWETAVVVLDVVLGQGAHPDPVGELVKAVDEAKRITNRGGGYLSVVASVTGTPRDPQGLVIQREKLEKAGVVVMPSNAQAARIAALIATKGKVWKKLKG
ncbi:MAG: FdrA family protein [Candidatus Hadarchaeaceae archaeon]